MAGNDLISRPSRAWAVAAALSSISLLVVLCPARAQSPGSGFGMVIRQGHSASWVGFDFARSGQVMVTSGGSDGTVRVWDFRNGILLRTLHGGDEDIYSARVDPSGRFMVAVEDYGKLVEVWDLVSGRLLCSSGAEFPAFRRYDFDQTGRFIISPANGGVWDLPGRKYLGEVERYRANTAEGPAGAVDGPYLAAGDARGFLRIWDWEQRTLLKELKGPQEQIVSVRLDASRNVVVTADWETIAVWDMQTGAVTRILEGYEGGSIALDPGGTYLAASSHVEEPETRTGEARAVFPYRPDDIDSVVVDPAERYLVAESWQRKTLTVWDFESGRLAGMIGDYGYGGVAFLPAGGEVICLSDRGKTLTVRELPTGRILRESRKSQDR